VVEGQPDGLVHRPMGSTQTGQPGPWIMRTLAGSRSATP
jgi:hypothetical protein